VIALPTGTRVWLAAGVTDMRRGMHGLAAMVQTALAEELKASAAAVTSSEILRRYTQLPALLYMLTERKLSLLDPGSWDDKNDSYYLDLYREKKKVKTVLALCFAMDAETYQHWTVFPGGSAGVCIQFEKKKLVAALRRRVGVR
jgi:IS66 Orf2 like protein